MISSGDIFQLYRLGIKAVIGNYPTYNDQWKEVFTTYMSDKHMEFEDEFKSLGVAPEKPEGTAIAQDSMRIAFQKTYVHKTYGISFNITQEAYDDSLYPNQFPQQLTSMTNSLREAKSQAAANVFNLGRTTELSIDGVPFFSANHPLDSGEVVSNINNVALSEIGVQDAIIAIQKNFKQLSGIRTNTMPVRLLVGPDNRFAAEVITGSTYKTSVGSAGGNAFAGVNDINAIYTNSYLPQATSVNNYILSPTFAAIITDADRGLIHYQRKNINAWSWDDNETKSKWFAASERYSFGVTNWRCAYQLSA